MLALQAFELAAARWWLDKCLCQRGERFAPSIGRQAHGEPGAEQPLLDGDGAAEFGDCALQRGPALCGITIGEQQGKGEVAEALAWLPEFSSSAVAEMNGKPLATMLGALQAMAEDGAKFGGEQFGGYAQSSGSGNASVVVWRR